MRCKFRTTQIRSVSNNYGNNAGVQQEELVLSAVTGPENQEWSKYTPYGELKLTITNSNLFGHIQGGKDYYLDLIPCLETTE